MMSKSQLPELTRATQSELARVQQELKKQELIDRNKLAARDQLFAISLMLARKARR